MWFFLAMGTLIAALLWALYFMTEEVKAVNESRALDAAKHSSELKAQSKEHIAELQSFIQRLSEVEKRRKK